MSIKPDNWKYQYERIKRCMNYISDFKISNQNDNYLLFQDHVFFFFQNCYHLKDWLKNCGYDNVKLDDNLEICRSIANGTKHLILDDYKKNGTKTRYGHRFKLYRAISIIKKDGESSLFVTSSTGGNEICKSKYEVNSVFNDPQIDEEIFDSLEYGDFVFNVDGVGTLEACELANKCIESWDIILKELKIL